MENPVKPDWIRISGKTSEQFGIVRQKNRDLKLNTVCVEAHCPNITECWNSGTATFMILGNTCTRHCGFCAVKSGVNGEALDENESRNIALAVKQLNLNYVVITSVDRDDLIDNGAGNFAQTVREIRKENPNAVIEALIPDFCGKRELLEIVVKAKPDVVSHNIETVRELQASVRDRKAGFEQSLVVLRTVKELDERIFSKSGLMIGLGEAKEQVISAMKEVGNAGVDFFAIGQYLRPGKANLPVQKYYSLEDFLELKRIGEKEIGFRFVASAPFVRSSYRAGEFFLENIIKGKNP